MRNVEIKCRCADLNAARAAALELGARDAGLLCQTDTFFPAPEGRLKVRDFGDGAGELIGYRRADQVGPRGSDYLIYRTGEPAALRETLAWALGDGGTVRKRRHLLLLENTRIHLDEVEGLGTFVELETVLRGQTDAEAQAELEYVAGKLGLRAEDHVPIAYIDLLNAVSR